MQTNQNGEVEDKLEVVNLQALRNWCAYAVRSVYRHKLVALIVAGLIVGLAATALAVLPKKYHVEARLLAQKNQVLAIAGDEPGADGPTRAAADVVMRRDNLVSLVKKSGALDDWPKHRAPIQKLKDALFGTIPEPELLDALVGYLGKQMTVWAHEGTVTIQIYWPDARMAYQLVEGAQQTFLEARHVQEVTTIAESMSILEGHAAVLRNEIDEAVAEIERLREERQGGGRAVPALHKPAAVAARASAAGGTSDSGVNAVNPRLSEIAVMVEAKQRVVRELETNAQRRVAELQARLDQQRAVYTDAHPVLSDARQALKAAEEPSPQVAALKKEIAELEAESAKAQEERARVGAPSKDVQRPVARAALDVPSEALRPGRLADEDDPAWTFANSRLRFTIENYNALESRIRTARINLDTAQAAFKYRYTVVRPPEIPKGPISPKGKIIMIGSIVAGLLVGIGTAIALDLRRGVVYESWQVEQTFGLPVVARIMLPASAEKQR
jgi:hypothetical protein